MTTQDPTEAAIEAMKRAYKKAKYDSMNAAHPETLEDTAMRIAFHAQNGLVRVVPVEATEEIIDAYDTSSIGAGRRHVDRRDAIGFGINEANKVGDLTKPKDGDAS